MFEKERSNLLKLIRSIIQNENGGFQYSPPFDFGIATEAVRLHTCAAQFVKNRVFFCRQESPAVSNVAEAPEKLTWRLECRGEGDRFAWSVDRLGGVAFTTEELARRILQQLRDYCESYEDSIESFVAAIDYGNLEA